MGGLVAIAEHFDVSRGVWSRDVTWFLESTIVQGVEMFVLGDLIEDLKVETEIAAAN
jgi:hypothetical protein